VGRNFFGGQVFIVPGLGSPSCSVVVADKPWKRIGIRTANAEKNVKNQLTPISVAQPGKKELLGLVISGALRTGRKARI